MCFDGTLRFVLKKRSCNKPPSCHFTNHCGGLSRTEVIKESCKIFGTLPNIISTTKVPITLKSMMNNRIRCVRKQDIETVVTVQHEINGYPLNFTFEKEDESQICPKRVKFYVSSKNSESWYACMKKCVKFSLCVRFSFFKFYLECKMKASRRCWKNEPCALNYIKRPNFCLDLIKGSKEITSEVYFDNEGGYCYTLLQRMNFVSAKIACQSIGMHVLKLWKQQDSDTGNSFFIRLRKLKFYNVWLGLHRASSADTFIWQSDLWKDFDVIPSTHRKIVATGLGEGACFTASLKKSKIEWVNRDCSKNLAQVICFRPIMGEWGPWVAWRLCSTCKERRMERHRDCNMPEPIVGSCLGNKFDYKTISVKSEPLPPYYYHILVSIICGLLVLFFGYLLKKIQSKFYNQFVDQLQKYEKETEKDYFKLKNYLADFVSEIFETSRAQASEEVESKNSSVNKNDLSLLKVFNQSEDNSDNEKTAIEKIKETRHEQENDDQTDNKIVKIVVELENNTTL